MKKLLAGFMCVGLLALSACGALGVPSEDNPMTETEITTTTDIETTIPTSKTLVFPGGDNATLTSAYALSSKYVYVVSSDWTSGLMRADLNDPSDWRRVPLPMSWVFIYDIDEKYVYIRTATSEGEGEEQVVIGYEKYRVAHDTFFCEFVGRSDEDPTEAIRPIIAESQANEIQALNIGGKIYGSSYVPYVDQYSGAKYKRNALCHLNEDGSVAAVVEDVHGHPLSMDGVLLRTADSLIFLAGEYNGNPISVEYVYDTKTDTLYATEGYYREPQTEPATKPRDYHYTRNRG